MKRSTAVVLVLSGAILGGCSRREEQTQKALRSSQVVTNDTYVEGRGYYHSPFHAWYPFPYNFYSPGLGYYRGGSYHAQPDLRVPPPTLPGKLQTRPNPTEQKVSSSQNVNRGGFNRGGSWGWRSSGS